MKEDMDASDKIRIQYASKYAGIANYWKYYIGQTKGLLRLDVVSQKRETEKKFSEWVQASPERQKLYGSVLSTIEKSYSENKEKSLVYQYIIEGVFQGSEIIVAPFQMMQLYQILKADKPDPEIVKQLTKELKETSKDFFKDYNAPTDKKIFAALLKMFYQDLPASYHFEVFTTIQKKYKGDFNKFADDVFDKSIFSDQARYDAFLDKPSAKVLENDWAFIISQQAINLYFPLSNIESSEARNAKRLFEKGLMEMQTDKLFYPDANSTLRLTYGTVGDYKPADATFYNYYTTLSGIMEKEDPKSDEFVVPAKLKELYKNKDYGHYATKDGDMHVCFTTNNDITGGNSGSGVINGNGELIGIAFDGNWEAMSGDIAYEKNLQKCINVDIRYVLFVIDKFAGAKNLIDEMKIVK
jgi:hypothetical protein